MLDACPSEQSGAESCVFLDGSLRILFFKEKNFRKMDGVGKCPVVLMTFIDQVPTLQEKKEKREAYKVICGALSQ